MAMFKQHVAVVLMGLAWLGPINAQVEDTAIKAPPKASLGVIVEPTLKEANRRGGPPTGRGTRQRRYSDEGPDVSVFTDYQVVNRLEKDGHIYMLPISAPSIGGPASVAFCQLAFPTLLWIADWTACRFYEPPEVPDPNQPDSNWILLDKHFEPVSLTLAGDGTSPLYRISGTYFYGHLNPTGADTDYIVFGKPAWMVEPIGGRRIGAARFRQGIINLS